MLAVGRALMSSPQILMMDEPSLGLAPLLVKEVFEIILLLREQGNTILLVEQNAKKALEIADYGYVLETGQLVLKARGKPSWPTPRCRRLIWARQGESRNKKRSMCRSHWPL